LLGQYRRDGRDFSERSFAKRFVLVHVTGLLAGALFIAPEKIRNMLAIY
jgi:hypothetical protein